MLEARPEIVVARIEGDECRKPQKQKADEGHVAGYAADRPAAERQDAVTRRAEKKEGDQVKSRVVVMGFGGSMRDEFLAQPVWPGGDSLKLDPPPTENADLLVNSLYWLRGEPQLISRGPVPVPRVLPMEKGTQAALRTFVWGIWPALIFAPGILLWYIRRR